MKAGCDAPRLFRVGGQRLGGRFVGNEHHRSDKSSNQIRKNTLKVLPFNHPMSGFPVTTMHENTHLIVGAGNLPRPRTCTENRGCRGRNREYHLGQPHHRHNISGGGGIYVLQTAERNSTGYSASPHISLEPALQ